MLRTVRFLFFVLIALCFVGVTADTASASALEKENDVAAGQTLQNSKEEVISVEQTAEKSETLTSEVKISSTGSDAGGGIGGGNNSDLGGTVVGSVPAEGELASTTTDSNLAPLSSTNDISGGAVSAPQARAYTSNFAPMTASSLTPASPSLPVLEQTQATNQPAESIPVGEPSGLLVLLSSMLLGSSDIVLPLSDAAVLSIAVLTDSSTQAPISIAIAIILVGVISQLVSYVALLRRKGFAGAARSSGIDGNSATGNFAMSSVEILIRLVPQESSFNFVKSKICLNNNQGENV